MVKEILKDKELLHQSCFEIDCKKEGTELRQIILDLKDTLRANPKGIGLSAPQIGYYRRVFIINFNGEYKSFVNPIINKAKNGLFSVESCLSCEDEKEYVVLSFDNIEFFYQTPLGKALAGRLRGLSARVFQHELNHLDGVLISDFGIENNEEFKNLTEDEKKELFLSLSKVIEKQKEEINKKDTDESNNT